MWKKKIAFCLLFTFVFVCFCACGKKDLDISSYVIEQRQELYTAHDDLYCVTLSTGLRENNYNFDGVVNEKVPFGVLTISRLNNTPLANDTYSYIVTIGEQTYNGFLEKNNDNSYSADLEINDINTDSLNAQISFTGYTFNKDLVNTSANFQVDSASALTVAKNELGENIKNLLKDSNNRIEVVVKIIKDHTAEELQNYFWYVGVVSTNGETLGILIDANNGDVIAKKV